MKNSETGEVRLIFDTPEQVVDNGTKSHVD